MQGTSNRLSGMKVSPGVQASTRIVSLMVIVVLAGARSNAAAQPFPPATVTQEQLPVQPLADQSSPLLEYPLVWNDILGPISALPGWSVGICEGSGPFLCVCSDHGYAGGVELGTYPLERMPQFRADLVVSPDGGFSALEALAKDFYQTLEKDRKSRSTGTDYEFSSVTPERVAVGNLPGLRYGFSGFAQNGRLLERSVHYTTFDSNAVYMIVAHAVSPPPGGRWIERLGEFVDDDLRKFEPSLAEIVKHLRFPLTSRRSQEDPLTRAATDGKTTGYK